MNKEEETTGYLPSTSLRAGNRQSTPLRGYDYSQPGAYLKNPAASCGVLQFAIMPNHVRGIIVIRDIASVGAGLSRPVLLSVRPGGNSMGRDNRAPTNATTGDTNATGNANATNGDTKSTNKTTRAPTLGNIVAYFKYQ
jgi:hypothetical protein